MSITLTDSAVSKIKEIISQDAELAGKPLRVYVESGGCSGYSYGFTFDQVQDGDAQQTFDGFTLLIDPNSGKLMTGAVETNPSE